MRVPRSGQDDSADAKVWLFFLFFVWLTQRELLHIKPDRKGRHRGKTGRVPPDNDRVREDEDLQSLLLVVVDISAVPYVLQLKFPYPCGGQRDALYIFPFLNYTTIL